MKKENLEREKLKKEEEPEKRDRTCRERESRKRERNERKKENLERKEGRIIQIERGTQPQCKDLRNGGTKPSDQERERD